MQLLDKKSRSGKEKKGMKNKKVRTMLSALAVVAAAGSGNSLLYTSDAADESALV